MRLRGERGGEEEPMGLFSMLKHNSKLALKQSWGRAVILLLIILGVSSLISVLQQIALTIFVIRPMMDNPTMSNPPVTTDFREAFMWLVSQIPAAEWIIISISIILMILLIAPLSLGIMRWFFGLVHGKSAPITDVFHYYETVKDYWRAIWYDINVSIRCGLWSLLFYAVPGAILGASVYFLSGNRDATRQTIAVATSGVFLSVVLFLLATLFYAACVSRYTLTPYLMGEDDEISVGKAIKLSIAYTKGFRFSLVWFGLSYIGWLLISIFFLPIFYVWPYYSTGIAMYARFIIEKNRYEAPESTREFSPPPEAETPDNI